MKVLIIDNYDSFTYILKQYFGELGGEPEVFFNDKITISKIKKIKPTHIVLSPGPGTVECASDVGITFDVIKEFYKSIPILGVCLGHQAIGKFFGYQIIRAPKVMHGKRSLIAHDGNGIFKGIRSPFEAMRYHSLMIKGPTSPLAPRLQFGAHKPISWLQTESGTSVSVTANADDGVIMAIQHKEYPVFGVQFHPESLGTPEGMKILKNFLKY